MTSSSSPKAKKQKVLVDLNKLAIKVWEHYRNYLDSLEAEDGDTNNNNNDPQGDIDELQELIDLLQPHLEENINPTSNASANTSTESAILDQPWKSVVDLLPVLVSVAYNHLAEAAIGEYLHTKGGSKDQQEKADTVQSLLKSSLTSYVGNAATWSMGANFGRMSHRLSLSTTRDWYERAVYYAPRLRSRALQILEDETVEDPLLKEWGELLLLNHLVGVEFELDEDVEANTNEDQIEDKLEDEDEKEAEGQYGASAVEGTSRFMCAMLWSMQGDHDRAAAHLQHFDLNHRLHPNIWTISKQSATMEPAPTTAPLMFKPDQGILPVSLYESMKTVFAPDSAYWKESNYTRRGYYSYFMDHDKTTTSPSPRNLVEDVIVNHMLPRAKQVLSKEEGDSICGFEWWTHTRQIQANLGHNLHFDTDEAILAQEGKVTHPILSSILYLTGGADPERPAGATIILDQTPDSEEVAGHCWQGTPVDNSFLIFPGNLLHGVLPCPESKEDTAQKGSIRKENRTEEDLRNDWKKDSTAEKENTVNRLTFMVGFWTRNVPSGMKERHLYGPCGPLPPSTDEHTWVTEMCEGYGETAPAEKTTASLGFVPATALPKVSPAWETLKTAPNEDEKEEADDKLILQVPYAIDHRFFVKDGPRCFHASLFEDRDGADCE